MILYGIETTPNAYGFGRDYTLNIYDEKKNVLKSFWLGQDAKVFARILGMDKSYAVEYYSKKANSENFEDVKVHIAEDIIKTVLGKDEIDENDLKQLIKANDWDLAVQ